METVIETIDKIFSGMPTIIAAATALVAAVTALVKAIKNEQTVAAHEEAIKKLQS